MIVALARRKVLVLGEFIDQLEILHQMLVANTEFTTGLYIGRMKQKERETSQKCDVILGTYKLASVGMDIPDLNTLVMASPRREIEQSVGRILRKTKNAEFKPKIVDFIDSFYYLRHQGTARQRFYRSYDYSLEFFEMTAGVDPQPQPMAEQEEQQQQEQQPLEFDDAWFRSDSDSD
jgi:superfamily II DNA or RNA helicase